MSPPFFQSLMRSNSFAQSATNSIHLFLGLTSNVDRGRLGQSVGVGGPRWIAMDTKANVARHSFFWEKEQCRWENMVARDSKDSRRLWKDISVILSHSRSSHSLSFSSDEFLRHLSRKVSDVRGNTEGTALPTDSTTKHHFEQFNLVTESELEYILTSTSSKSCTLNPIPAFLHDLISERLPFVVRLCNTSFMEEVFAS